jgi:hypothetical protein
MAVSTGPSEPGSSETSVRPAIGPPTLREWALSLAPRLQVVSASVPEPTLEPRDTLAILHDARVARALVLHWERIQPHDDSVGFVALGADPGAASEVARPSGADPEGVGSHTLGRILKGGLPGAAVGAVVVAGATAVMTGWDAAVAGAGFGGAAFGAVAGGVLAVAKGTGWGEAYQHAFVDPTATDVVVASFHATDAKRRDEALAAARGAHGARLARVDANGRVVPIDGGLRDGGSG